MSNFTAAESRLINRLQLDIPICARPYSAVAADTGLNEADVISMTADLKSRGIIRSLSAIFNTASLGYETALVAMETAPGEADIAADIISSHPGVSHNYLRENRYNIWFTLAVAPPDTVEEMASLLANRCAARDILILRNEKLYKIGLALDVSGKDDGSKRINNFAGAKSFAPPRSFTDTERQTIVILQKDLPAAETPFAILAEESESALTAEEIIETGGRLRAEGVMRRYSAVLRHRKAGFSANAMTVWRASGDELEKAAQIFLKEPSVSHLYKRTVYPGKWEYPLFAMLHGHSREEVDSLIAEFSEKTKIKEYLALYSTKEYKKKRVKYFSDEITKWKTGEGL